MSEAMNTKCHPLYVIEPSVPLFIREGEGGDGAAAGDGDSGDSGDAGQQQAAGQQAAAKDGDTTEGKKDDSGSNISENEAKLLKDMMKWKEKARSLETSQSALQAKVDGLANSDDQLKTIQSAIGDLSVDDLKTLVDARKEAERKALEDKGQYEQIVEQMRTENETRVNSLTEDLSQSKTALVAAQQQIESLTVGRAFSDSTFLRERSVLTPGIAMKEFGNYFDFSDGRVVAYNKPRGEEGRAPLVDADGQNHSFDAAIEKLYSSHPESASLLKSKQKPGAGSKSQDAPNGSTTATKQLRGLDRISAGLQQLNS